MLRHQGLEVLDFGIEQAPDGDHGVDVLVVQGLQFAGHIGEVGIEDGIAFGLPPEPILHHRVQRNMLVAIALGDPENLVLRDVAVLRLEEAVGPLREHGCVAGHGPRYSWMIWSISGP